MTFDEFCERLRNLRLDRSGGLKSVFHQLLALIYPAWPTKTKAVYPIRHLETDGFWKLVPIDGASGELRAAKATKAAAWNVLRHVKCAELDEAVFERLATRVEDRVRVLDLLARTYFPAGAREQLLGFLGDSSRGGGFPADRVSDHVAEETAENITERALEEHIETNWHETPFAELGVQLSRNETTGLPGRQVLTEVNSIDLLGFHPERREWWVIELKRGRPNDAVVGQVSRYLGWIQEAHCGEGRSAVGVIIARDVDRKLRLAAKPHAALSLWQFDERLQLEQVR